MGEHPSAMPSMAFAWFFEQEVSPSFVVWKYQTENRENHDQMSGLVPCTSMKGDVS